MASSSVQRIAGPTYALSVANTQHAAINVAPFGNDIVNFASFINTGANPVCVTFAPFAATPATPVLVFPVDGTPTVPPSFVLPAAMQLPVLVAIPATPGGFSVSAIGSVAGPSIIYVTPLVNQ